MEENEEHFLYIPFYFEISEMWITKRVREFWFANFPSGVFPLNDAPRPKRPVKFDSDQMKILPENCQHYAASGKSPIYLKYPNQVNEIIFIRLYS